MAKESKYMLACRFFKAAVDIAVSDKPVTEERLIVGEFFIDLGKTLLNSHK